MSESSVSATPARVTLINPPSAPGTLANREGAAGMGVVYSAGESFLYPPHTIAAVAASLRQAGHAIRVLDLVVGSADADALQADVIGVLISWATLRSDLEFLTSLRAQTAARLVAFGSAMRFLAERVALDSPVDAVVVGEPEGCLSEAVEFIRTTSTGGPSVLTNDTLHATRCDVDGWVKDLDSLPFPAWDLVPTSRYPLLSVFASRGCPDSCLYCPYSAAQGHRWRDRSIDRVVEEVAWLVRTFSPQRVVFRDPVFAYQRGRVADLCERLITSGVTPRWECESRPEHFDTELLKLMHRAGCSWVKIGLETTDSKVLADLRRVESPERGEEYLQKTAQVVETCRQIGLGCRLFVMSGLPGQNSDTARHTASWVSSAHPAALNIKRLEPYPGTIESHIATDIEEQTATLLDAQAAIIAAQRPRGLVGRARSQLRMLRKRLIR